MAEQEKHFERLLARLREQKPNDRSEKARAVFLTYCAPTDTERVNWNS